jgi:hypothetical protein
MPFICIVHQNFRPNPFLTLRNHCKLPFYEGQGRRTYPKHVPNNYKLLLYFVYYFQIRTVAIIVFLKAEEEETIWKHIYDKFSTGYFATLT